MEVGKNRLKVDTLREANTSEEQQLKKENTTLKEVAADLLLKNRELKKT